MINQILQRLDTFLALYERHVKLLEADLIRQAAHDAATQASLEQAAAAASLQADASQNMASSSHTQTGIARKHTEILERTLPPTDDS